MSYKCISNFGSSVVNPSTNPLNYCLVSGLDSGFNNGGIGDTIGNPRNKHCQAFMSDYCSTNWNGICEQQSQNQSKSFPNTLQRCDRVGCDDITAGDVLVANTAARKYLSKMNGTCNLRHEPFDPTVAGSPMINFWEGSCNGDGNMMCMPVYEVDPKTIDTDPVMDKLLAKPIIALNLLVNIHNTARRTQKLHLLKGTKIYNFFMSQPFQNYVNQ
jgi:hypothetical protein